MSQPNMSMLPGTILGVPRNGGGYYCIIFITLNRFGYAYGLFDGFVGEQSLPSDWKPIPIYRPVYSGDYMIETGHWVTLGYRADLLNLFPKEPELYHYKAHHPINPNIGMYGSAESPTGEIRSLTLDEATSVGLVDGSYRQIWLEEQIESFLGNILG